MRALRFIHLLVGILALALLAFIAWAFVQPVFQRSESSRVEAVQVRLEEKLQAYRFANGRYPDSLQALPFTNSPTEVAMQSSVLKFGYHHTESGYELSYDGLRHYRWAFNTTVEK